MLPGAVIRNPRVGFEDWVPMVLPSQRDQALLGRGGETPAEGIFAAKSRGGNRRPQTAGPQRRMSNSILETRSAVATLEEKQLRRGVFAARQYTGHVPETSSPEDELRVPLHKDAIMGYSGHLHGVRSTYGATFNTCIEQSHANSPRRPKSASAARRRGPAGGGPRYFTSGPEAAAAAPEKKKKTKNDEELVGSRFERLARYHDAVNRMEADKDMTPKMLLNLIQAKVQERSFSSAQQKIRMRCIFSYFDKNGKGEVDEGEFRSGLELMNVQLSDAEACAAFAIFDPRGDGIVSYDTFYEKMAVPNPRGGTAIYPKAITTTKERFNLYDHTYKPPKGLLQLFPTTATTTSPNDVACY